MQKQLKAKHVNRWHEIRRRKAAGSRFTQFLTQSSNKFAL